VAAARGRFARNAMVQGAAAEFFKAWALTVRVRTADLGAAIVLCLHDELLVHAPAEHGEAAAAALHECLEEAAARWFGAAESGGSAVRFVADVSVVARWSDRLVGRYGRGVTDLPGLDLGALTTWLDTEHPGLRAGELDGEVIAGGKSNLTYRVTDGTNTWALRRPPLAHVLPTAHDMVREYRVISALHGTAVPVAETVALCEDVAVIGSPFYLMSFVDGLVLDKPKALAALTPEIARRTCDQLVDTLVELHSVEPASWRGRCGAGTSSGRRRRPNPARCSTRRSAGST